MKAFISSLIGGYTDRREAVAAAARAVRCDVIRAEDFGARPDTPQQACLSAVRDSDLVVLVLGAAYGERQGSGLSATHEEWREAVGEQKPILVFVEQVTERAPAQSEFIDEVQQWAAGRFRESFSSTAELQEKVTQALHDLVLAGNAGPVDDAEMRARAERALPEQRGGFSGRPSLGVAVACGPQRQVIRPAELEEQTLGQSLQQAAMFGPNPTLDPLGATHIRIDGSRLWLEQGRAQVSLDEDGTVLVVQPAIPEQSGPPATIPSIIHEELTESLARALRFAGQVLEMVDPLHRVTDVVPVAALSDVGYMPWRTRAEQLANPSSATMGGDRSGVIVGASPQRRRRSSLAHEADRLAEDLAALIRRAGGN